MVVSLYLSRESVQLEGSAGILPAVPEVPRPWTGRRDARRTAAGTAALPSSGGRMEFCQVLQSLGFFLSYSKSWKYIVGEVVGITLLNLVF